MKKGICMMIALILIVPLLLWGWMAKKFQSKIKIGKGMWRDWEDE